MDADAETPDTLRRRLFQLETLYEIGRECARVRTVDEVVRIVLGSVMGAFGLTRGVAIVRDARGGPISVHTRGLDESGAAPTLALDEAVLPPAWLAMQGLEVVVPFGDDSALAGAIAVGGRLAGEPLTPDDRELLATIVANAAPHLRTIQLLHEVQQTAAALDRRVRVLGVINEIALGVAARPSTQRLHRFLAERIADVVGASTATLALREDDGPAGGDAAASGGSWRVAAVHPQLTGTAEVVGQVGQTELLGALAGQLAAADQWHSDDGRQIVLSIRYGGDVVGALWLRRDGAAQPFDADDRVLLRLLANEAAVVMETGRLIDGYLTQQQEQFRLRAILEQYVSTSVAERLISGEVGTTLEGERRVVTVFMADMRNSTQLTTALDPAETVALLNEYLGLLTDIVFGYEGTIEKIEGDGVAVLFGAPVGHEDDPLRAVRAAAVAQREVLALLERWRRRFPVPASIGMGIGIATGELIVGNVGSAKLLHYTTTGPTINLAARLTSRAPAGTAQLDETTWRAVAQPLGLARGRRPRRPRHIRAKGFPHLVPTYRLGPRDLVAVS